MLLSPTKQLRTHRRAASSLSPLGLAGSISPARHTDPAGAAAGFCQPAVLPLNSVATLASSCQEPQQASQARQFRRAPSLTRSVNRGVPRSASPTAPVRPPHPGAIDGLQLRQRLRQGKRPSPMRQVQQLQERSLPAHDSGVVKQETACKEQHHVSVHPAILLPAQARQLLAPAVSDGSYAWVCVHQGQADEAADVYLMPWDQGPMNDNLHPRNPKALTVYNHSFASCKLRYGSWHNFLVRVQGGFHELEEEAQWPNQASLMTINEEHLPTPEYAWVQHGQQQQQLLQRFSRLAWAAPQRHSSSILKLERTRHNLRDLDDLVGWLADPVREDVVHHLANLQGFLVDKSPEDHYAILCNCYGSAALQALNITRAAVVDFLLYRSGPLAEAALSQGIKRLYIQHYRLAYGLARTR